MRYLYLAEKPSAMKSVKAAYNARLCMQTAPCILKT